MIPETLDLDEQFPIRTGPLDRNGLVFLNHAAVGPMSLRAAKEMTRVAALSLSSAYTAPDWYAKTLKTKALAAQIVNAKSRNEIAFIPNTTTGIANLAGGLDWQPGDRVVITDVEYPANRYPWTDLKRFGVEVVEAKEGDDLRIKTDDVIALINDRTRVVSVSHVQYASGFRIDLRAIADAVHAVGGLLCVDAIQSVGVLPVDVQAMGIDFLSADGHKWMLGPEGAGFLYCKADLIPQIRPAIAGWLGRINALDYDSYDERYAEDAKRFEPGCWNIAGNRALGASLELLLEVGIDNIWQRVDALNTRLRKGLGPAGYRVLSPSGEDERSGIVAFVPRDPDLEIEMIEKSLRDSGIVIALRGGRLRASPHFYNTDDQIDRLLAVLATLS